MKAMIIAALILVCVPGCVSSFEDIRSDCESKHGYNTPRYNDCVSDGQVDAEHKRAALRAFGESLQQAGQNIQNNSRQMNCHTTCSFGTCYTHCQ